MKIRAPAKINLYLKVVGRRSDGYHLIDSLMVPVSLYDEVTITRPSRAEGYLKVTCDHPNVPKGKGNLAHQAANLLLGRSRIRNPIHIHIRKKIPLGAGLGGASTDAAAVLIGLNRLFRIGLTTLSLSEMALDLGADVPFFVQGRPATARGIGERLNPVSHLPKLWLVLLYPGFQVSTRWVYDNLKIKLTKILKNTKFNLPLGHYEELVRWMENDLERATIRRYPIIGTLKERLIHEGAMGVLMSGSGSSVFGIFAEEEGARKALRRLRMEEPVQAYVVYLLT